MPFEDLGDYVLDGAALTLPYKGKKYRVPPVPADVGLRAEAIGLMGARAAAAGSGLEPSERDREILSDAEETDLYRDLLGTAYDEMLADKIPWVILKHAAMTVLMDCTADRETAEQFWLSLGKRPAPADKKAPARKTSSSTAPARRTRSRASTPGTTSRQR